jgi:hypothetical protein
VKSTPETKQHAQEVLDFLEHNNEGVEHDQTTWFSGSEDPNNICGTTMCVAGTSVYLKEGLHGLLDAEESDLEHGFMVRAASNLGLTAAEDVKLFLCMNEEAAKDMLRAVTSGDEKKFDEIYEDSQRSRALNLMIFKANGAAPSLNQVVHLARAHVTDKSRQKAREVDSFIYQPTIRRAARKPKKSRYERINERYDDYDY